MKKKDIKGAVLVVGAGIILIGVGLFSDYSLTIIGWEIPQWGTVVFGVVVIVSWAAMGFFPDKLDDNGDPIVDEGEEEKEKEK